MRPNYHRDSLQPTLCTQCNGALPLGTCSTEVEGVPPVVNNPPGPHWVRGMWQQGLPCLCPQTQATLSGQKGTSEGTQHWTCQGHNLIWKLTQLVHFSACPVRGHVLRTLVLSDKKLHVHSCLPQSWEKSTCSEEQRLHGTALTLTDTRRPWGSHRSPRSRLLSVTGAACQCPEDTRRSPPPGLPSLPRTPMSAPPGLSSCPSKAVAGPASSSPQPCPAQPWLGLALQAHVPVSACPCAQGGAQCLGLGLPWCPQLPAPGWGGRTLMRWNPRQRESPVHTVPVYIAYFLWWIRS